MGPAIFGELLGWIVVAPLVASALPVVVVVPIISTCVRLIVPSVVVVPISSAIVVPMSSVVVVPIVSSSSTSAASIVAIVVPTVVEILPSWGRGRGLLLWPLRRSWWTRLIVD